MTEEKNKPNKPSEPVNQTVNKTDVLDNKPTNQMADVTELPEEVKKKLEQTKSEKKPGKIKKKKRKIAKRVNVGTAHIQATYNNTIVTLTDPAGEVLAWASAGVAGFKGPKKSTPYAAQIITKIAVDKARQQYGLNEVSVLIKGVGTGRESAIRALNANGLIVTSIKDVTPIPHNGCRPRKIRRV